MLTKLGEAPSRLPIGKRRKRRESRFTEVEILYAVKQVEMGIPVREIAYRYGASDEMI